MRLVRRLLASGLVVPPLIATVARAQPLPPPPVTPPAPPPGIAPPAPPPAVAPPALPAAAPPVAPPPTAPAPPTETAPPVVPSAPETLETPYAETPPPAPPPPAAPATGSIHLKPQPEGADTRPLLPIRAQRRVALLGEVGWNGLAGFGAIVTYHATPHFSLDIGGGFSLLGWKGGVRGRYNFSTDNFTPFVGVGFNATSGLGQITSDPKDDPDPQPGAQPFTLEVKPSYLAQGVVGFEIVRRQGFTMQGAVGYARLLNHDNTKLIDGSMTPDERTAMNVIFKSGPVISMAFGTSFK